MSISALVASGPQESDHSTVRSLEMKTLLLHGKSLAEQSSGKSSTAVASDSQPVLEWRRAQRVSYVSYLQNFCSVNVLGSLNSLRLTKF